MDKHGNYIEERKHELFEPELLVDNEVINEVMDENPIAGPISFFGELPDVPPSGINNVAVTGVQKDIFCTGVAFSGGGGVSASAGSMSIGAGIDQGFGYNSVDEVDKYESATVWGLCGGGGDSLLPPKPSADDAPRSGAKDMDVGISFEATAGFWSSVG